MNALYQDIIRNGCTPLQPIPTDTRPDLRVFAGARAVLFDVYGTMLISSSGDVGTAQGPGEIDLFGDALSASTISFTIDSQHGESVLNRSIRQAHTAARSAGVDHPEIDIVTIWQTTLEQLVRDGCLPAATAAEIDLRQLAVEYEVRSNPTWPMPGLTQCLSSLSQLGLQLGIVSNAQFYTRELFPALLGETVEEIGFDARLQFYSYQFGEAKPGKLLYQQAANELSHRGIASNEVVYIGNDLLNDVLAASQVGFRTVLFAGDARSLRTRRDDPRVRGISPDAVITELVQLTDCFNHPRSS